MNVVHSAAAPAAIGPYSQAIVHGGLVYCSGQIALDPATGALVSTDVAGETRQVLANLEAVLAAAGAKPSDVLKTTVFLVDMADFPAMNEVYAPFFAPHKPARATVAVAGLPRGVRVEIECVAAVSDVR
jgi:2-iminobutanoate/2-iminopropanoate deaminase